MTTIAFFRQKRRDDAIRNGVEINDAYVWELFEEGDPEHDPRLLWFIDITFQSEALPVEPEAVRDWLLARGAWLERVLVKTAESLEIGFDVETRPFKRSLKLNRDVRITLMVSAIRRLTGRKMAVELRELAKSWAALIARLEPQSWEFAPSHATSTS